MLSDIGLNEFRLWKLLAEYVLKIYNNPVIIQNIQVTRRESWWFFASPRINATSTRL